MRPPNQIPEQPIKPMVSRLEIGIYWTLGLALATFVSFSAIKLIYQIL